MPIRRFLRQYERLSQFEGGRIIVMKEAGWPARRVARQLGHSDCAVRRCWDQRIREIAFTRRPGSGHPRQTSRRETRHIVRNAHVQPTASSATIQAQVWCPSRLPINASVWNGALHVETELQRNGSRSSLATNPDSISAVMSIEFLCGDPVVNASILSLPYSHTPLPQLV
ncbi:uncharacterized protein TNCV_913661 [Trichonephila clavipes]|nr:uncharacterized protein TNCV_913661 [Trichonephila clavipes]